MKQRSQSRCPVCYALDLFGDRWTLLIVRDVLVHKKRNYNEFLNSKEKIATNILSSRLKNLVEQGFLVRADNPDDHGQAYLPTEKTQALLPVLDAMARWAMDYGPDRLALPPG